MKALFLFIFLLILSPATVLSQQTEVNPTMFSIESIQGFWTINLDENVSFIIEGDSIFFFEYLKDPLPIEVKNDSLLIHYENFIISNKIIDATPSKLVLLEFNQDTTVFFNTLRD